MVYMHNNPVIMYIVCIGVGTGDCAMNSSECGQVTGYNGIHNRLHKRFIVSYGSK